MIRMCCLLATVLLTVGWVRGQDVPSADSAPPQVRRVPSFPGAVDPADEALNDSFGEAITAGDPTLAEEMWQRTWGEAGMDGYPAGRKMAPNGVVYQPLASLDLVLNIALTRSRRFYLFTDTRFWMQKANDDATNPHQGAFDFSKRQFDFASGIAYNYIGPWEVRAFAYSYNNLNRGTSLDLPAGFNDGFAVENRYYFPNTNFDKGLYRFLALGYYFSKDLTGGDGQQFEPSVFARASLALDVVPDQLYLYSDTTFITRRPVEAKLLLADVGVAVRPFASNPDLEFRIGGDNTYDMQAGKWRALLYGNVRIVW